MKLRFFAICLVLVCLMLTGCGGAQQALDNAVGTWYLYGDLHNEVLEIDAGGNWTRHEYAGGALISAGTVHYEDQHLQFQALDSGVFYGVKPVKNGRLTLHGNNYYSAELCRDDFSAYNGRWDRNGDSEDNYLNLDNGHWGYLEDDGYMRSMVRYGHLESDGKEGFIAWNDSEYKADGRIVPQADGTLRFDGDDFYYSGPTD